MNECRSFLHTPLPCERSDLTHPGSAGAPGCSPQVQTRPWCRQLCPRWTVILGIHPHLENIRSELFPRLRTEEGPSQMAPRDHRQPRGCWQYLCPWRRCWYPAETEDLGATSGRGPGQARGEKALWGRPAQGRKAGSTGS